MSDNKYNLQSSQYNFPYHYLVDLKKKKFNNSLSWGLDYFNYMGKVIELVNKYIKDNILDIGCGDGFLLNNLKKNHLSDEILAVGLDIDEKPIKFAQAFASGIENLFFLSKNLNSYDKKFNLITIVETLEHIADDSIGNLIGAIDRCLETDGILVVSVPSTNVTVNSKHYRHYSLNMIKNYFPNYELLEYYFITYKNNIIFRFIEHMLCNGKINLNFSFFRNFSFYLNQKYFFTVNERQGAHIVLVFKKI